MKTRSPGKFVARSIIPFMAGFVLFLLGVRAASGATQVATIARQGSFETITDVGARDANGDATNSNSIERFVMSADGSAAVYAMTESPLSAGCPFSRQIRRVDIASRQDVLIGGCTENLAFLFYSMDISDNGTRIVYIRDSGTDEPEMVLCDFNVTTGSCTAKTVLLRTITTALATLDISPNGAGVNGADGSLVLSGDGNKIFFRNNFGANDFSRFSTVTMYEVAVGSPLSQPSLLFEFPDLAMATALTAGTNFVPSLHAVDFTGSKMVFDSRAPNPTVGWHDVAVIDTAIGLASVNSIANNTICCFTAEPDISSDGQTVAYARLPGSPAVQTGGIHVQRLNIDLTPAGSAVVVDPDALAVRPCLSGDGTTLGLYDDTPGGDNHIRMTPTDRSQLLNVSQPAIEMPTLAACRIQDDGSSILLHGVVKTNGNNIFGLPRELLLFRWQTSPATPKVLGVTADPTVWLAKDSFTLHPWMFHTYFWDVAFSAAGAQLERGYSALLDGGGQENNTLHGDNAVSGFLDDGTNHDRVAADAIFTDPFIWVDNDYPSADPSFPFPNDQATLRFGIAASNGTATHVDVVLPVFPEALESAQTSLLGTFPVTIGNTRATLQFDAGESGEATAQLFDYAPPDSLGSTGEFWRIFSGAPQGFFGGNGITSAPYDATLTLAYANVTNPALISLFRTRDGVNWEPIAASVDAFNNEITTAAPIDDIDGLWAIGEGTPIEFDPLRALSIPLPTATNSGDAFGTSVDLDSNLMVVGLPGSDLTGPNAGAVAVYRIEGGQAVLDEVVQLPAPFAAAGFGASVAISGDTLVVGTSGMPVLKGTALAAAVFQRPPGGSWGFKQPLTGSGSSGSDGLGASVAISGDLIVVGAPDDDENETAGSGTGAAYVFDRPDSTSDFQLMDKLKLPAADPSARFGQAVALRNAKIAVGAPNGRPVGGLATGSVSLYEVAANVVNRIGTATGSNTNEGSNFGSSVDISGDGSFIVGSPEEDDTEGMDQGVAYVFSSGGGVISQTNRIKPSDPAVGARFGAAVAIDRRTIAVGSPLAQNNGMSNGAVYRFRQTGTSVNQLNRQGADSTQSGFGAAVSVSQDKVLTGAPDSNNFTGSAVLELDVDRIFASDFES